MLSISSRRMFLGPEKTLAFGAIAATFNPIGTPMDFPARAIYFNNLTNTTVTFTADPSMDQVTVGAGQARTIEFTTNRMNSHGAFQPANTQWYVRYITAPGNGAVYIAWLYGKDN